MTPNELRQAFAKLKPNPDNPPLHTWPYHQMTLRQCAEEKDPLNLLSWPPIVATMFVGSGAKFTSIQLSRLPEHYLEAIKEPRFGNPQLYNNWTSGNLIHQAYHLWQWEQKTEQQVKNLKSIVEFGGGYGAMALLSRRLGFTGKYTIIDLPELSLLQKFYLSNTIGLDRLAFIDKKVWDTIECDLFIALYSLSEVPIMYRYRVLKDRVDANSILISHQNVYGLPDGTRVDNIKWSETLIKELDLFRWWRYRHDLPGLETHWYVIGQKK